MMEGRIEYPNLFLTAVMEDPLPRWHVMMRELLISLFRIWQARFATYLWLVPWKPYFLTLYFS